MPADQTTAALQPIIELSPRAEAVFRATVLDGKDSGASVTIDGSGEILVGQSPVCALRIADPTVSRRHLVLEVAGNRLRVRDCGSSNGTLLGNVSIVEVLLGGGETLLLGSTQVRVDRVPGAAPPALPSTVQFGDVVGVSREMRRLYPLLERLASIDVPVLIEGETGTGKELVARAIHDKGKRASGPFVVLDCTAVTPALVESELFGHERGAFTGAVATRKGVFEQADHGTLFIDEIGDLPVEMQAKLLRAIERAEVRRVGGDRWIHTDVRIVAATRRDIDALVQEGRFRDDLFHRLAVSRLELPPLRRRRGDILALAEHFCRDAGSNLGAIDGAMLADWSRREWPGNVRELRNAVTRELALGDLQRMPEEPPAREEGARDGLQAVLELDLPFFEARQRLVEAFQRAYLERILAAHDGSVQRAAQAAGIAPRYFRLLRARRRE